MTDLKKTIRIFGEISQYLTNVMGMHAENMLRKQNGESIAYSEQQFEDIRYAIQDKQKEL